MLVLMEHVSALVSISDLATISAGVVINVSHTNNLRNQKIIVSIGYKLLPVANRLSIAITYECLSN